MFVHTVYFNMTLRKTFDGDFKKMELTWGTAERGTKERYPWRRGVTALFLALQYILYAALDLF